MAQGTKVMRRMRRNKKKNFKKAVKRVINSISEKKFTDVALQVANQTLDNFPAVRTYRLDTANFLPNQIGSDPLRSIQGREYEITGMTFSLVVQVNAAAIKQASARISLMQFRPAGGVLQSDVKYTSAGDGLPVDNGRYLTGAASQNNRSAPAGGSCLRMFANDTDPIKFISSVQGRLPIWGHGYPLASGVKKLAQWTMDTHRPEGDFTSYVKRMQIFWPMKKKIHVKNIADTNTQMEQIFKYPTYLVLDGVQWALADSIPAEWDSAAFMTNATAPTWSSIGIGFNLQARLHYRDY